MTRSDGLLQIPAPKSEGEAIKFAPKVIEFAGQEAIKRGQTFVLILGGLDRLTSSAKQQRLAWLPSQIPPGVFLLISCNSGPILEDLENSITLGSATPTVTPHNSMKRSGTGKSRWGLDHLKKVASEVNLTEVDDDDQPDGAKWDFIDLPEFSPREKVDAAVKFLALYVFFQYE